MMYLIGWLFFMAWDWFEDAPRVNVGKCSVTVLKTTGSININAVAYSEYFTDSAGNDKYKSVIFGFDKENRKVAIKPLKEEKEHTKGAYAIRKPKRKSGSGATVSAKAFLTSFGIEYKKSQSYLVEWDEKQEALVFALDDKNEKTSDQKNK